jgi:hypothetical protein
MRAAGTVSHSRSAISSPMARETWVFRRSHTNTMGALTSWWTPSISAMKSRSPMLRRLPFARSVGAQAVAQPGPGAGPHGDHPGHGQSARASSAHCHLRGVAAPAPGASPGRSAGEACLVLEADVAPTGRPDSFTSAQVASFHAVTACSSRSATRRAGTCGCRAGASASSRPRRCRRRETSCRSAWPPSPRSTPGPPSSRARPDPVRDSWRAFPDSVATGDTGPRSVLAKAARRHRLAATTAAIGMPTSDSRAAAGPPRAV